MSHTFICRHCKQRRRKNPRIKGRQNYCGSTACQQVRKNTWERSKMNHDPAYKAQRTASKQRWYDTDRRGAEYQSLYRKRHPEYVEQNRKKQKIRNQKRTDQGVDEKIVKTDGLGTQSVGIQGTYLLVPYGKRKEDEKIVKTDALLVQLIDNVSIREHLVPP